VASRRADEWKIEVGILKLGVVRVDFVDEEWDVFLISIGGDRVACRALAACSAQNNEAGGQTWNVERIYQGRKQHEEVEQPSG
jgi:hypothetical protein